MGPLWVFVSAMLGAGMCLSAAAFVGTCAARVLPPPSNAGPIERALLAFGLGLATLSNIVFALCLVNLASPAALLLVWLASAGLFVRLRTPIGLGWRAWRSVLTPIGAIGAIAAAVYGVMYLISALAPPITADGVTYHLGLVRQYSLHHGFHHDTQSIYAFLSQGTEMLFLFAYTLGGESATQLVHLALLGATAVACYAFGGRIGQRWVGLFGAVLFATAPVVGLVAASPYNDAALALFCFLSFYWYVIWREAPSSPAALGGVLAGFCFAIKYTGAFAACLLAPLVALEAWRASRSIGHSVAKVAVVCVAAVVMAAPWLLKNYWTIGNPVAPFFNAYFPNPYVSASWEHGYSSRLTIPSHMAFEHWRDYLVLPYELTVGGELDGVFGIGFLLAPLALLGLRDRTGRALMGWSAVMVVPWLCNYGARFLIPAAVFLALALGVGLAQLGRWGITAGSIVLALHSVLSAPPVLPEWTPKGMWLMAPIPWSTVTGLRSRQDYLSQWALLYDLGQDVAQLTDKDSHVLSTLPLPEAFLDARVIVSFQSSRNAQFLEEIIAAKSEDDWPTRTIALSFEPQRVRRLRIVQQAGHESQRWRAYELLFRHGKKKVAATHVTSSANRWFAQRLVDGDKHSLWQTHGPLENEMYLEATFAKASVVDQVEIISPKGQYFLDLALWIDDGSGNWVRVTAAEQDELREGDPAVEFKAMARAAGQAFAHCGIDFVVMDLKGEGHNIGAPAVEERPAWFGLEKAAERGSFRVYRVVDPAAAELPTDAACPN